MFYAPAWDDHWEHLLNQVTIESLSFKVQHFPDFIWPLVNFLPNERADSMFCFFSSGMAPLLGSSVQTWIKNCPVEPPSCPLDLLRSSFFLF